MRAAMRSRAVRRDFLCWASMALGPPAWRICSSSFLWAVRSSTRRWEFFWKSGDCVLMEDFKTGTGDLGWRLETGQYTRQRSKEAKRQRSKEAEKGLHRDHRGRRVRREEKNEGREHRDHRGGKRPRAERGQGWGTQGRGMGVTEGGDQKLENRKYKIEKKEGKAEVRN